MRKLKVDPKFLKENISNFDKKKRSAYSKTESVSNDDFGVDTEQPIKQESNFDKGLTL
jgi:CRP-like cAMP-binding protein